MFVVRKIISSKFKHNGQNIWQKLGWVSLHSQTSIRPDYNELRLGRAQLIKMVDTVMKAFVVKKVGHRLRNICNAMDTRKMQMAIADRCIHKYNDNHGQV